MSARRTFRNKSIEYFNKTKGKFAVKRRRQKGTRRSYFAAGVAATALPPILFALFTLTNDNAMNRPNIALMSIMAAFLTTLPATVMGIQRPGYTHR